MITLCRFVLGNWNETLSLSTRCGYDVDGGFVYNTNQLMLWLTRIVLMVTRAHTCECCDEWVIYKFVAIATENGGLSAHCRAHTRY